MTAPTTSNASSIDTVSEKNSNGPANYLKNIKIIMVNTTLPANIGSAARAMLTMGLTNLVVVNPKHPIDEDSIAHAAGAQSVLENCRIVETLEDAIADCNLVFAASSRQRHIPRPVVTPDKAAQLIIANPMGQYKVGVLFGREDRGLTNDELALADYHIQIDANPAYPVLNVASAIQVISSFFYSRFLQHSLSIECMSGDDTLADISTSNSSENNTTDIELYLRQNWDTPAITQQQKQGLESRIIELMYHLDLVDTTDRDKLRELPSRLSRLTSRLQLDQKEFELISSVIAKLKRKL